MSIERTAQVVQVAFPQVYLACHTRHQRKKSTVHRLSARDSSILSHLDPVAATTPARLDAHLGVAPSTLSEALKRLTLLGYTRQITREAADGKRGGMGILLSANGAAAIRETSVLETPRLLAALERLSPAELRAVSRGMSLLARACARAATGKSTSIRSR
jgi:DNA-binding MarR family transcriptional regulator